NGDRFGNNGIHRKIRLLVQPKFKSLVCLPSGFDIVYGDVTDKGSLLKALANVRSVFHMAAVIYPKDTRKFNEVNYQDTKNLVDACIEGGVRRSLYMGTDSICGYERRNRDRIFDEPTPARPYKKYGKSKHAAEKYLLDKTSAGEIEGTSLRGFWFFGPFMPER